VDSAEQSVVALRVVPIDTAGEDGDRHPIGRNGATVRTAVDAERSRLDDDKYPIAAQPGMCTLITDDA
jgi:hypothetical protein